MLKPNFTPRETYRYRDTYLSVAAVAKWAGYADKAGWWNSLNNSGKFWFASEFLKQRGKRNK